MAEMTAAVSDPKPVTTGALQATPPISIMHLAYIDPGAGSYVFQLLIAAVSGVLFFFSSMKGRIAGWFQREGADADEPAKDAASSDVTDQPDHRD